MPSPRDTMRLPEPLPTHVHASWETTRTPLVTRIREALSASLADKMPTGLPLCADSTDPLTALHTHVTDGTARVQGMEDILTAWSQRAARNADRRPDTAPTPNRQATCQPSPRPPAVNAHGRHASNGLSGIHPCVACRSLPSRRNRASRSRRSCVLSGASSGKKGGPR
jgi:hypothetical protein